MENYPVPLGKKGGSLKSLAMYILVVFSLLAVFGLFFLPLWKLAEVAGGGTAQPKNFLGVADGY